MMEREHKKDDFIRNLLGKQGLEKAPDGFADKVMSQLTPSISHEREPIFSPVVWFTIFLGAAAIVVTMLFVDIPYINDIFSSTGIQKLSFNIFNNRLFESYLSIFTGIQMNATIVIIIAAALSLVVIERVLSFRRSSQKFMLL